MNSASSSKTYFKRVLLALLSVSSFLYSVTAYSVEINLEGINDSFSSVDKLNYQNAPKASNRHVLEYGVNDNRGDFQTSFSIPLGVNRSRVNQINFNYSSGQSLDQGIGIGFGHNIANLMKNLSEISLGDFLLSGFFGQHSFLKVTSSEGDKRLKGLGVVCEKSQDYKASIEGRFLLLKRCYSDISYILEPKGETYAFNKNGELVSIYAENEKTLELTYEQGRVKTIKNPSLNWKMFFSYENFSSSQMSYMRGHFIPTGHLKTVDYFNHDKLERTTVFSYQGNYLIKVQNKKSHKVIFKGEYQKLERNKQSVIAPYRYDGFKAFQLNSLNRIEFDEKSYDKRYVFYRDINGDKRDDQIIFDYRDIFNFINKKMQATRSWGYNPKCGPIYGPTVSLKTLRERFAQGPDVEVRLAQKREDQFVWDKRSSQLEQQLKDFGPLAIKVELSERHNGKEHCYYTYDFSFLANGLHFTDLNRDGLSDVLLCPNTDTNSKNQKINPILSALNSRRYSELDNVGQVSKATSLIMKVNRTNTEISDNSSLYYYTQAPTQIYCHQNSLLVDINRDGISDIINGRSGYLIGASTSLKQAFDLENLISVGETPLQDEKTLALYDKDADGKLDLINTDLLKVLPLSGETYIHYNGELSKLSFAPSYKVMTTRENSLGAELLVSYKVEKGHLLTDSVTTMLNLNSRQKKEVKFKYNSINGGFNLLSGVFEGFDHVERVTHFFDNRLQNRREVSEYYIDNDEPLSITLKRSALPGKLKKQTLYKTTSSEVAEQTVYTWDYVDLGENRIYPYLQVKVKSDYSGGLKLGTIDYITSVSSNLMSVSNTKQERHFITPVFQKEHRSSLTALKKFHWNYDFYRRDTKQESSFGDDDTKLRFDRINHFNSEGRIEKSTNGELQTFYHYKNGQLVRKSNSQGSNVIAEYCLGSNQLCFVNKNGELTEIAYDTLWGKVISRNQKSQTFVYKYNKDNDLKEVQLNGNPIYSYSFSKDRNFQSHKTVRGVKYEEKRDGLGHVIQWRKKLGNRYISSGELEIATSGKQLKAFYPALLGSESAPISSHYNFSGVLTSKEDRQDTSNNEFHNYQSKLNRYSYYQQDGVSGDFSFTEVKDSYGHIVYQEDKGEGFSFKYNGLSDLISKGDDFKWEYDLYGNILNVIYQGKTIIKNRYRYHNKGVTKQMNDQTFELNSKNELVHFSSKNVQINKRYNDGLLVESDLKAGKNVTTLGYCYNENKLPILVKSGDISLSASYDDLGKVTNLDYNGQKFSINYESDEMINLLPTIKKIHRNDFRAIEKIEFANITLDMSYFASGASGKLVSATMSGIDTYHFEAERDQHSSKVLQVKAVGLKDFGERFVYTEGRVDIEPKQRARRNGKGTVRSLGRMRFEYNDALLSGVRKGHLDSKIYYDESGRVISAVGRDGDQTLFLTDDSYTHNGKLVSLVRVEGLPVAVIFEKKVYPVVTDWRGSIVAQFNEEGKLLWQRDFDTWGNKRVTFSKQNNSKEMERLTVWSFAGLKELPSLSNTGLYWSGSRVYSSEIGEWLSLDPLLLSSPKELLTKRGNWKPTEYCDGDPVNFVDPSGHWAHIAIGAGVGGFAGGLSAYYAGARGWDLVSASLIGAASGAASATGVGGILGGMFLGLTSNVGTQLATGTAPDNLNLNSIAISTLSAGIGAGVGSLASKYIQVPMKHFGSIKTIGFDWLTASDKIVSSAFAGTVGGSLDFGLHNSFRDMSNNAGGYESMDIDLGIFDGPNPYSTSN